MPRRACYIKGWSLRCSRCGVKLVAALGRCMWGRGQEGAMAPAPLFRVSVTPSATHNQIGPLWCSFLSGWACAHSRPLWVCPTTSPVRLGVSPAAAPTPTGVFNQRFESLFPPCWSLGLRGLLRSPPFVQFICGRMWCRGVLPTALPAPFSATLSPALWVYLQMWGHRVC